MSESLDFLKFAAVAASMLFPTGCTVAISVNVLPSSINFIRNDAYEDGLTAAANDRFGYPPAEMNEDDQQEWLKGWEMGIRAKGDKS